MSLERVVLADRPGTVYAVRAADGTYLVDTRTRNWRFQPPGSAWRPLETIISIDKHVTAAEANFSDGWIEVEPDTITGLIRIGHCHLYLSYGGGLDIWLQRRCTRIAHLRRHSSKDT